MNTLDIALICKSLGDASRLQIIAMLSDGEKCACELLTQFEITQPTLSYHMKNLTESGLVDVRKDGKWSYYRINCDALRAFKAYVNGITCSLPTTACGCQ